MQISSNTLDSLRKRYLDEFTARGIELNNDQLETLNSYIIKQHSANVSKASEIPRPSISPRPASPNASPPPSGGGIIDRAAKLRMSTPDIPDDEFGTLDHLRKAGVAAWYGLESYGWGLPGLALKGLGVDEPYEFEELTAGEKATAVAAGGVGLVLPGPGGFRGVTKGLELLASKFARPILGRGAVGVQKMGKEAVKDTAKSLNKAQRNLGLDRTVTKYFNKEVSKGYRDIIGLNAGKEAKEVAVRSLEQNLQKAALKAIQESGVSVGNKAAQLQLSRVLRNRLMKALTKDKKPVHDIGGWVESVIGGTAPGKFKQLISRYTGMAVTDAFVLGAHAGGTSYIHAAKLDQEWQPENVFQETMMLAAAFPVVRGIVPYGGKESLRKGLSYLWNKYKITNYKKMANESGGDALRGLLFQFLNRTDMVNRRFPGLAKAGKDAPTGLSILHKIDDMPVDDVIKALNSVRKDVAGSYLKNWKSTYLPDFIGSLPRMAMGVGVMNHSLFADDTYKYMDKEELLSHMMVAAVMTKGRGRWDHEAMQRGMIDFGQYKSAMRTLGIRGKELDNLFNVWDASKEADVVLSGPDAKPILDIFTGVKGLQKGTATNAVRQSDKLVADMAGLYNAHLLARTGGGQGYEPINYERFDRKTLNSIKDQLEQIKFSDGTMLADKGFEGVKTKLNAGFARHIARVYAGWAKEMNEHGAPVDVDVSGDNIKFVYGEIRYPKDKSDSPPGANKFNVIMEHLRELGFATKTEGMKVEPDKQGNYDESVSLDGMHRVSDKYENNLTKYIYGKNIGLEGTLESNRYLDAMYTGKQSEALDRIYNMMVERDLSFDKKSDNFLSAFKNLFYSKGLPAKDWADQIVYKASKKLKDAKEGDPALEAEKETFAELKSKLGEVNALKLVTTNKGHNKRIPVTLEEMQRLSKDYESVYGDFPNDIKLAGVHNIGLKYFLNRYASVKDIPEEVYTLYETAMDPGVGYLHLDVNRMKVIGFKESAIEEMLLRNNIKPGSEEGREIMKKHRELTKELSMIPNIEFENITIENNQVAKMPTPSDIENLYNARKRDTVRNLVKEAAGAVESLNGKHGFVQEVEKINELIDSRIDLETPIGNQVKTLTEVERVLDSISGRNYGKAKHIKQAVEKVRKKVKYHIKTLSRDDPDALVVNSELQTTFLKTVKETLATAEREEKTYSDQMHQLVLELAAGTAEGHLTPEMAELQKGRLKEKLIQKLNQGTETMSLDEAIDKYHKTDSWYDFQGIITKALNQVNQSKAFDNIAEYHDATRQMYNELREYRVRRNDVRSPVQIARDWGLTESREPNKIDPKVIEALSDASNPGDALYKIMRQKIKMHDDYKGMTKSGQEAALRDFAASDGVSLLSYALNSTPVKRAKIVEGKLVYDTNESSISSPTIDFFNQFISDKKGNIKASWLLDESGTIPRKDGGSQRFMLGLVDKVDEIQDLVNQQGNKIPSYLWSQVYKDSKLDINPHLSKIADAAKNNFKGKLVLMRIANRGILFEVTPESKSMLNSKFQSWYDKWINSSELSDSQKKDFRKMWEDVLNGSSDAKNLELKMSVAYIDEVLDKRFMKEYLSNFKDPGIRSNLEAKLYQRAYIAGNSNGQRINKKLLSYMAKRTRVGNWSAIEQDLRHYRDNGAVVGLMADELKRDKIEPDTRQRSEEWNPDSPFHTLSLVKIYHQNRVNDKSLSPALRENAQLALDEISQYPERYKSLESSTIDGVEYVSERFAKVLWALKGGKLGDWNGLKPYIFQNTDDGTMIAKGYYVFEPSVSSRMGNVDILMGESSAKIFGGRSLSGAEVSGMQITNGTGQWLGEINAMPDANKIRVDIENISLGVHNVDKNVASRSHTMTDYQSKDFIKQTRIWQELDEILKKVQSTDRGRMEGSTALIKLFDEVQQSETHQYSEGSVNTALMMIRGGATANNPILRKSIERLVRGPLMDIIRSNNSEHSVDAMISPDFSGKLKMPVFSEVERVNIKKDPVTGKMVETVAKGSSNRVQLEIGGVKVPYSLGKRKIINFNKTEKGGVTFVFNSGGLDVLVSPVKNKKGLVQGEYKHSLEDLLDAKTEKDRLKNGLKRALNPDDVRVIDRMLQKLSTMFEGQENEFGTLFQLIERIKSEPIVKGMLIVPKDAGRTEFRINKRDAKILKKLDIGLSVVGHPMPRIGLDASPLRVQNIGTKLDGKMVQINAYDLRTGFQRDNDGDKFYLHHDMGVNMMNRLRDRYSNVRDYPILDKTPNDMNIFGLDGQNRAGKVTQDIGFGRVHSHIQKSKIEVGRAISMKSALTTLSNNGLKIGINVDNRKQGLMADLGNLHFGEGGTFGQKWMVLERFMRLNQSSVDYSSPGSNALAKSHSDAIIDAMLFGIKPSGMSTSEAREFGISAENALFHGKGGDFTSEAKRNVVKEVINMVKKSSRIFNDVYDEGGQRLPLDYELRDAYSDLRLLYGDTQGLNQHLFSKLFRRAVRNKDNTQAQELLEMFYGTPDGAFDQQKHPMVDVYRWLTDTKQSKTMSQVKKLFDKGKIPWQIKINEHVSFDNAKEMPLRSRDSNNPTPRAKARIDASNAGYILDYMMKSNLFGQPTQNWGTIKSRHRSKIGLVASDIVESFDMIKTMIELPEGSEFIPSHNNYEKVFGDQFLYSAFDSRVKRVSYNDSQKRGMVKVALETEQRGLQRALRYEQSDKYRVQEDKINSLQRKLDTVSRAIEYVEELGYRHLVKDPKQYKIRKSVPFMDKKGRRNYPTEQKINGRTYVYRFSGSSPSDKMWNDKGKRPHVNFEELTFVGNFQKGDSYERRPGNTYLEFFNPIAPSGMDKNSLRHSYALLYRTISADPSDWFSTSQRRDQFIADAMDLRRLIGKESQETSRIFRENKAVSPVYSNISKSKIQHEISKFMQKFVYDGEMIKDEALFDMAFRYIMQPRSIEGFLSIKMADGKSMDIPAYRMSDKVILEMSEWALQTSGSDVAKKVAETFLKDWTNTTAGITSSDNYHDGLMQRSYNVDYYTSNVDKEFVGTARHMSGYGDVQWQTVLRDNGALRPGKRSIMQTADNARIYIRALFEGKQEGGWCF